MANYPFKIGKATVNSTGGGITNAEVIEYAETLPTASETSPNFVQTPDGTLYRKKAVEGGELGELGEDWVKGRFKITDPTQSSSLITQDVNFSSNNQQFSNFYVDMFKLFDIRYDNNVVFSNGSWTNSEYAIVDFGEKQTVSSQLILYLTLTATPISPSVSYEYVAMQEVPTPTTADNGKVLGVTNGAYALQEASGGGGEIYMHNIITKRFTGRVQFYTTSKTPLTFNDFVNGNAGGGCFGLILFNNATYFPYQIEYDASDLTIYLLCSKVSDGSSFTISFGESSFDHDFVR